MNQDKQLSLQESVPGIDTANCFKGSRKEKGRVLLKMFKLNKFIPTSSLANFFNKYHHLIMALRRGEVDDVQYDIISDRQHGVWGWRFKGRY